MHRSGTSAIAGVLARLGIDVPGDMMLATKDNPKGYFENIDVFLRHEAFLREIKSSWDDPMISDDNEERLLDLANDIQNLVFVPNRSKQIFIVKDPRLCLTMPAWLRASVEAERQPKCLHIFRHPAAVGASLAARDGLEEKHSLMLWLKYVLLAERSTRKIPRCFANFDDLLANWTGLVEEVADRLTLPLQGASDIGCKGINGFLDQELCHHTTPDKEVAWQAGPGRMCQQTLIALKELEADPYDKQAMESLDQCFVRHKDCSDLYGDLFNDLRLKEANAERSFDHRMQILQDENTALIANLRRKQTDAQTTSEIEETRANANEASAAATKSAAISWRTILQNRRSEEEKALSSALVRQKTDELERAEKAIAVLQAEVRRLTDL